MMLSKVNVNQAPERAPIPLAQFDNTKTDAQPKALWVMSSIKMWESFSFYGMRGLLVLFMTSQLGFSDARSLGIYALFTCLIEALALCGGFIADRILGLQRSIFIGCILITIGHISFMIFPLEHFYLGLGFVATGTGLFRTNSTTLLGLFYRVNDPRRDQGFTFYYSSLNVGGFLAGIFCGYVGETYGWDYGFSLAAMGMLIGLSVQIRYRSLFAKHSHSIHERVQLQRWIQFGICLTPFILALFLYRYDWIYPLMPLVFLGSLGYLLFERQKCSLKERNNMDRIGYAVLFLILFFAVEEQVGSSLVLFASRHVNTDLWGVNIPISSIIAINPLTIMVVGPLLTIAFPMVKSYEDGIRKIMIAFAILFIGFIYLLWVTYNELEIGIISHFGVLIGVALAELFIGPTVWAICTALSPQRLKGTMMGLVTIGYACANFLGGFISQWMALEEGVLILESMANYRQGFWAILFVISSVLVIGLIANQFVLRKRVGA